MKQLIFLLGLAFFIGCHRPPSITQTDPGWQMFNYPRTTMQPGYVFRIKDGEKAPQEVTTLKTGRPFDTGYAYLPVIYEKRKVSGNAFVRFLFLNPNDTTLKMSGNKNYEVSLSIGKGYQESIDEPTIDDLVKKSNINWRENNKYYIIQSTMSTKQIRYKSQNTGGFDNNIILNFSKVNSTGHLSKDKVDSSYLNQDFDGNYRVYYRALEINSMGAASSNNKTYTYKEVAVPVMD